MHAAAAAVPSAETFRRISQATIAKLSGLGSSFTDLCDLTARGRVHKFDFFHVKLAACDRRHHSHVIDAITNVLFIKYGICWSLVGTATLRNLNSY